MRQTCRMTLLFVRARSLTHAANRRLFHAFHLRGVVGLAAPLQGMRSLFCSSRHERHLSLYPIDPLQAYSFSQIARKL